MKIKELRTGDRVRVTLDRSFVQAPWREGDRFLYVNAGCEGLAIPVEEDGIEVEALAPDFEDNTVWADRTGHLWLAQTHPADLDEENDTIRLHSSLGEYSIEEAMESHGPFWPVRLVWP